MVGSSVGCDFAEYGVGAAVGIAGSSLGSEREVPDRGEMSPSGMGICAPSAWSSVSAGAALVPGLTNLQEVPVTLTDKVVVVGGIHFMVTVGLHVHRRDRS